VTDPVSVETIGRSAALADKYLAVCIFIRSSGDVFAHNREEKNNKNFSE
jgi:hypothetical protein